MYSYLPFLCFRI